MSEGSSFKRTPSKSKRSQFHATRQWNHIVNSFQEQVPIKPVRYRLRLHPNSFTGAQAVSWLKDFFQNGGVYGNVTTPQVEKFCRKLLEMGVIVDATRKAAARNGGDSLKAFSNSPYPYTLPESVLSSRRQQGDSSPGAGTPNSTVSQSASLDGTNVKPMGPSTKLARANTTGEVPKTTNPSQSAVALIATRTGSMPSVYSSAKLPGTARPNRLARGRAKLRSIDNRREPVTIESDLSPSISSFDDAEETKETVASVDASPPRESADDVKVVLSYHKLDVDSTTRRAMVLTGTMDDVLHMLDESSADNSDDTGQENDTFSPSSPLSFDEACLRPFSPPEHAEAPNTPRERHNTIPLTVPVTKFGDLTVPEYCRMSSCPSLPKALSAARSFRRGQRLMMPFRKHVRSPAILEATLSLPSAPDMAGHDGDPLCPHDNRSLAAVSSERSLRSGSQPSLYSTTSSILGGYCQLPDVWKEAVLSRLLQLVEIPTLEAIIHCVLVDGSHVAANCGYPIGNQRAPFVPLSSVVGERRRTWPAEASYSQLAAPPHACQWSVVHNRCPRSTTAGVNITYTPLICSAMDYLSYWPKTDFPTCSDFWMGRCIDEIIPTLTQHFTRVTDGPITPVEFFPLFISVYPLLEKKKTDRAMKALQYCLLLLPPDRRVLLERILSFIAMCGGNVTLILDLSRSNLDVLLDALCQCLLPVVDASERRKAEQVVRFMVDNRRDVFQVPGDVVDDLQDYSVLNGNISSSTSFDMKVSGGTHQKLAQSTSDISGACLLELLDTIIAGSNMSTRERTRRLKEFKKVYPHLYAKRFPSGIVNVSESSPSVQVVKKVVARHHLSVLRKVSMRIHRSLRTVSSLPRNKV